VEMRPLFLRPPFCNPLPPPVLRVDWFRSRRGRSSGCALPAIFPPPSQPARASLFCCYPRPRSVQPTQRGRVCSAAAFHQLDPRTGSVVAQLQWASRQSSTWSPARPSSPLPWPTSCPDTIVLFLPFLPLPVLMRRALVVARLQAQTGRQERPLPLVVAENSWPQPWSVERCAAASLLPFLSLPVPARPPAPRNPSTHAANTWKDGKLVANPSEWFGKYQGLSPASRDLKN